MQSMRRIASLSLRMVKRYGEAISAYKSANMSYKIKLEIETHNSEAFKWALREIEKVIDELKRHGDANMVELTTEHTFETKLVTKRTKL